MVALFAFVSFRQRFLYPSPPNKSKNMENITNFIGGGWKQMLSRKLEIKNLSPEEENVEINKNLCLRCESPVINGIPYEDGFYCNSCA